MMHLNKKTGSKDCGYCKGKKENPGSATWGIGSPRLSTTDYENIMNYGWRRCGTYIYKYDLEQSCCQPYTIRLNVNEFKMSNNHKKVLKKFNAFLINGEFPPPKKTEQDKEVEDGSMEEDKKDQDDQIGEEDKKQEEKKNEDLVEEIDEERIAQITKLQDLTNLISTHLKLPNLHLFDDNKLQQGLFISPCRDKKLKDTCSWSSNILNRMHFILKKEQNELAKGNPKEFVESVEAFVLENVQDV